MLRKILLLALILTPAMANAEERKLHSAEAHKYQRLINQAGYTCEECDGGHKLDGGYTGQLYRIYCEGNTLTYRVVLNEEKRKVCIEPWDNSPRRCQ